MACRYAAPHRREATLDLSRFDYLQNGNVVLHWFRRGWERRGAAPEDCFEPFIFTWIALNAWGECVSRQERDEDWVKSLALDPELNRQFAGFLDDTSVGARAAAERFRQYWPIPRVQVWRRDPNRRPVADTVHDRARFFHQQRIPCEPGCAWQHFEEGEEVPLDWEHFLPAVYRVRCNLFHGEKSPYDPDDGIIVQSSFQTLVSFMARLGPFSR